MGAVDALNTSDIKDTKSDEDCSFFLSLRVVYCKFKFQTSAVCSTIKSKFAGTIISFQKILKHLCSILNNFLIKQSNW